LLEVLKVLKTGIIYRGGQFHHAMSARLSAMVGASTAQNKDITDKIKLALSKCGIENGVTEDAGIDPSRVLGNQNLVYESIIECLKLTQA
jgi:hypothetical protein